MKKSVSVMRYPRNSDEDVIAVEDVLAIDLCYGPAHHRKIFRLSTTMRTPGHDRELAIGLLFSLGIIEKISDIVDVNHCVRSRLNHETNETITLELKDYVEFLPLNFASAHARYSGCGVCGTSEISTVHEAACIKNNFSIDAKTLRAMPALLKNAQKLFEHTGGAHGAGFFDAHGKMFASFEDVGRHNALDKLIGHGLQKDILDAATLVLLSSRASFEIVEKARRAHISVVAVMGAVSSLAVTLAEKHGITLVGFLRADRFNVYTHPFRIVGM